MMYEPRYLPRPDSSPVNPGDIRFSVVYSDRYIDAHSPERDPLHLHKQLEIFINVDSDISFFVNNRLYTVPPKSAVISMKNDLHLCIFNSSRVHTYYCLWIDGDFADPAFSFLQKERPGPVISFDHEDFRTLVSELQALYELYAAKGSPLLQTAKLLSVLASLDGARREQKGHASLPPEFQAVLDGIHENYASMKSIDDLTKNNYISRATLNRLFRRYLNTSPHEYLVSQKLSYAAGFLEEGKTVTEACMAAGFSDCSRFIVLFKRRFGMTPMRYKRNIQA